LNDSLADFGDLAIFEQFVGEATPLHVFTGRMAVHWDAALSSFAEASVIHPPAPAA
jgi:hypothetical protein